MTHKNLPSNSAVTSITARLLPLAGFMLLLLCGIVSAHATVTALRNTGYTYTTAGTRMSLDGEVLSPFFDVTAGGVPLYVYTAQVRSAVFVDFTSGLTNTAFSASGPNGDNGTFTTNLGTASFVQFQLAGNHTVLVNFPTGSGYPKTGMLTSASQVKIIGPGGVTVAATVYGAGQSNPQGSFSFPISEKIDTSGNDIPQSFTVEVDGDWLNSLHIFINPAPTTANSAPTGSTVQQITPGTITQSSFSTSYQIYHLPHGIYNATGPLYFGAGAELYLDDGAIIKYTGSANKNTPGELLTLGGYLGGGTYPAIVRGWGILDGQAAESYMANGSAGQTCTTDQQVIAPMCRPTTGTLGGCGYGDSVLGFQDFNPTTAKPMLADGIVLRNSCAFTFVLHHDLGTSSSPVTVNNIKILNFSGNTPGEGNSDGIDVESSQFVNITNSFIRSMDDLISIKQLDNADNQNPLPTGCTATEGTYPTVGINFVGNTLWNEYAHAMVVGGELYNACNKNDISNPLAADDITFDSNTVIHDTGKGSLMGILDSFGGKVQNITFSNMNILQATGLWNYAMVGNSTTSPGIVGGSAVCNITSVAQTTPQTIIGYGGSPVEPQVGPVPFIQQVVALASGDTYNGNPQAIQYPPKFYNVVVNGATVSTTVDGNDYYYKASDGYIGTNSTTMPQNVVEQTVKIRSNADPNSIWAYNQTQIPADMYGPQFFTSGFSCPVSPLLQATH